MTRYDMNLTESPILNLTRTGVHLVNDAIKYD